jgi:hypothetical protein
MRRVTIVLIAVIAALAVRTTAGRADQQPPQSTFRATVRLIVQPVSVKDKQGQPVLGLTAKDFVVTEDGQPQEIAFVEYQALDDTLLAPPAWWTAADRGRSGGIECDVRDIGDRRGAGPR